jgi:hypothetical protein
MKLVFRWRRIRWADEVAHMTEIINAYTILVSKPKTKRAFNIPGRKWRDDIKILLHVHPLLGNELPRRYILGKGSVARLRKNRWGCVLYVVRGTPSAGNGPMNSQSDTWHVFYVGCVPKNYKRFQNSVFDFDFGSNTSTVTLQVVGGEEKGSLKSETVIYAHESHGTRTRERLRWREPAAYTRIKDRPVLSSKRAPQKNKTVTVKQ